jgi:hypothetical protein
LYRIPVRRGAPPPSAEATRSIPEVQEIRIFMHLRTEKNVFAWGQRLGEE